MTEAKMRTGGGIYELTWAADQVLMRVDRLAEDSRYNTTGEMIVLSTLPGVQQHIHQARVNLVSTVARRTLIRELEQRAPDLSWQTMVEEMSIRVLAAYRQGEPVIQMSEHLISERVRHRLSPLLQEGQPTVFFGQGETGKSWLSLLLSILISAPQAHIGFTPEPGGVLYLDYETGADDVWERVDMITAGMGIAIPDNLYYRYMVQPVAGDIENIQREVMEKNISLVVVDSAAPASVEPETSAGATAYFQALRSLKCTSLTVAHTEASGKQDRPFGSIFWRNLPRANYRFRSSSEPGADELVVGIKQTKANNGRRMKDLGLSLRFSQNAVVFGRADLYDVDELAETLPLRERIIHLLRKGGQTSAEITEQLGVSNQQVRNALSKGHRKDFVMIGGGNTDARWGLQEIETL